MFKHNKYSNWYNTIIESAKSRELSKPYDRHHIIPKSLGGSNDPNNIVRLTPREHFICHRLLVHMVSESVKHKMAYAAWQQSRSFKFKGRITSRTFEYLRNELAKSLTGKKREPFSDDAKKNMRAGAKNRKRVPASEKRIAHLINLVDLRGDQSGKNNPFFGKHHSPEVSDRLSRKNIEVFTGVPKTRCSCVYCKKEVTVNILPRYHGDRCKFRR